MHILCVLDFVSPNLRINEIRKFDCYARVDMLFLLLIRIFNPSGLKLLLHCPKMFTDYIHRWQYENQTRNQSNTGYTLYTVSNSRNPTTVFVLFTVNFTPSSKTQAKPKREIMESNELQLSQSIFCYQYLLSLAGPF